MATRLGGGRPPDRRQRRRRDAAEHPRRHAPAQPRGRRHELRRGRAVERGRRGDERRRHRARRRARRAGLRRRALHRARPALDLRRRAGHRSGHRAPARDHRPHRRHGQRAPAQPLGRRRDGAGDPGAPPARRCASATTACARATASLLRPEAAGAALVTAQRPRPARPDPALVARRHGHDPGRRRAARAPVGRSRPSPSPLEDGDAYLVRPRAQRVARRAGPRSSCASSATAARGRPRRPPRSTCAAATSSCSPCSRCTAGRSPPTCCAPSSTATTGHPASIRVEMSRLRKLLHGAIDPDAYGLICDVDSDLRHVRALLGHNAVARRRGRLPRPAAARSPTAPGIRARARGARGLAAPGGHHLRRRRRPLVVGPDAVRRRGPRCLASACSRRSTTPTRAAASPPHGPQRSGARPCSGHVTPRVMH